MSKRPELLVLPKSNSEKNRILIKASHKVAIGHQSHIGGTGVHDNRPKRLRTRAAQKAAWKKEF